jgi:hypothetical protein
MSCKDNKDGSCTVEYIPFTPGDYDVNITFGGRPIPGNAGVSEKDAGCWGLHGEHWREVGCGVHRGDMETRCGRSPDNRKRPGLMVWPRDRTMGAVDVTVL